MSKARYRATAPATLEPGPARRRWPRRLFWLALAIGYAALLWYVVFPWIDRTFVNRPAL